MVRVDYSAELVDRALAGDPSAKEEMYLEALRQFGYEMPTFYSLDDPAMEGVL